MPRTITFRIRTLPLRKCESFPNHGCFALVTGLLCQGPSPSSHFPRVLQILDYRSMVGRWSLWQTRITVRRATLPNWVNGSLPDCHLVSPLRRRLDRIAQKHFRIWIKTQSAHEGRSHGAVFGDIDQVWEPILNIDNGRQAVTVRNLRGGWNS